MFKIVPLLILVSAQAILGQVPRTVLYSDLNQQGDYLIVAQTYAPDLRQNNFDNRANSVCVTGIWMFYVNPNYNTNATSGVEYVFGNDFCTNLNSLAGYVSSVRFAGDPYDYKISTFTLYESDYFQGEEEYTYTDLPNLYLPVHKSIIITGNLAWTIFDQPSYSGNSICLFPEPSPDVKPYLIQDIADLQIPYGSIRSVRKGCIGKAQSDNNVEEFARFGKA